MTIQRPACCVCSRPCIPLADYELPVCIGCDLDAEMVLRRAEFVVTRPANPRRLDVFERPYESFTGPAAPEVIEQLVDELFPEPIWQRPAAHPAA